jgi:hypothetical protein
MSDVSTENKVNKDSEKDFEPYEVFLEFNGIDRDATPTFCYALAHNRVPLLSALKISGGPLESRKITIRFRGEWAANERPPIVEKSIVIDAPQLGTPVEVSPVHDLQLSDIALAELEELAPASLIIQIEDDLGNIQEIRQDVDIYARDQWLNRNHAVTAAFVQPNHPDTTQILSRASKILERNGTPGLSGYQQAESGHHHRIAEAVYQAMQEFGITYINPPASYAAVGQKLRPIDRVLSEKQGTCIDLACAYASCLEQAGLHPVIFLVNGHAFSGYLAKEASLNSSVTYSWNAVQSLLDSRIIVPVETVCLTNNAPFSDAVAATLGNLNEVKFNSLVDVAKAHSEGIRPIPARVIRDNVLTVVIDNGPSSPPFIERRDTATRKLLPESVPTRIQAWKNSLLDLSFRNRLLNLNPSRHGVKIIPPLDMLGWVEDHLNNGSPLQLKAIDSLNEVQAAAFQRADRMTREALQEVLTRLGGMFAYTEAARFKGVTTRLQNEARTQEEETGVNCLYLTLGSVKWADKYGDYESPIFLVPIRIKNIRGVEAVQLEMDATQSTTVNYCLIEALRFREQMILQWFNDDMSDDLGLDIQAGLEALRVEFRERGLDVQGFSVNQTASLAVLDFKKFRLWKDLSDHWTEFVSNPLVKHLVETPRERFQDPASNGDQEVKFDDTSVVSAQSADGSQIRAIERALSGQSFVLQGPPGSGKSQTITNLLANAMHRGKKVLFVAEKLSALEEVQERLEEVLLGPYCLVLHDSGTKPEKLREQLRDALDQNPNIDERIHRQFEDEFAVAAGQLDEYRRNVYGRNNAGFSFASAYSRLGELGVGPVVDVPRSFLEIDQISVAQLLRATYEIEELTRIAQTKSNHPWALVGELSFDSLDRAELARLLESAIESATQLFGTGSSDLTEVLKDAKSIDSLVSIANVLELKQNSTQVNTSDLSRAAAEDWLRDVQFILTEWASTLHLLSPELRGTEELLLANDCGQIEKSVTVAVKSFAIGRKKKVTEALGVLSSFISPEKFDINTVSRLATEASLASKKLQSLDSQLSAVPGATFLIESTPTTSVKLDGISGRAELFSKVGKLLSDLSVETQTIRNLWSSSTALPLGLQTKISEFANIFERLSNLLGSTEESIKVWAEEAGIVGAIADQHANDWRTTRESATFLPIQRWSALQGHLAQFRQVGLEKMASDILTGQLLGQFVPVALERGILTTSLAVQAEATNLDVFDRSLQNRRVYKFIAMLEERKRQAQVSIPYFLYKSRKINAGVSTGKVGDFRRDVNSPSKRKRGRSIRSLIESYPDIVSDLTPCFLMSPDSVAQFLPPGKIVFDIVVFDEASQIVTADAVGAMGRAKSVVIVGDSKQMPPTKFGAINSVDDDSTEDNIADEEDSILEEAVVAGVPETLLTWHYRSQDESLISFSNEHYYESRLSTFPAPVNARADLGVFYRRVNGQFDHGKTRTNEIEANAIIDELKRRLNDPLTAELSYGIVTMNIQQRNLINALLAKETHPRIRELTETEDKKHRLFVLNLENVQGRERDVIILGTSFSKRADGSSMPLNFGPLTQQGGEKRLNVAVTRAKRQFVVVTSFEPEEMKNATSLGMNHLRDYLSAARNRSEKSEVSNEGDGLVLPQVKRIADALRERGIVVAFNRGMSKFKVDLALTLPHLNNKWLVAVLFDSEEWSERPLAIDRDALPVTILENVMKWQRVARVWMPSLRIEIDDVINELSEQVQLAAQEAENSLEPSQSEDAKQATQESNFASIIPEEVPETAVSGVVPAKNLESFTPVTFQGVPQDASFAATTVALQVLEGIVDHEGPISAHNALKRTAKEFGIQRFTNAQLQKMWPLLGTRPYTQIDTDTYLWPTGIDPSTWRSFRQSTIEQRKLEEVTPYEVVNAMESVVQQSISISEAELIRWTATFFGAKTLTEKVQSIIKPHLQWAVKEGRFHLEDGYLTLQNQD